MRNPYSAIVINPSKHSRINASLADAFVDFLVSPEAQQVILDYQVSGQSLFYPTRTELAAE